MYREKAITRKLIEKITDLSIEYLKGQAKHGIDVFQPAKIKLPGTPVVHRVSLQAFVLVIGHDLKIADDLGPTGTGQGLDIQDVAGDVTRRMDLGHCVAGAHRVMWYGHDDADAHARAGWYQAVLQISDDEGLTWSAVEVTFGTADEMNARPATFDVKTDVAMPARLAGSVPDFAALTTAASAAACNSDLAVWA